MDPAPTEGRLTSKAILADNHHTQLIHVILNEAILACNMGTLSYAFVQVAIHLHTWKKVRGEEEEGGASVGGVVWNAW